MSLRIVIAVLAVGFAGAASIPLTMRSTAETPPAPAEPPPTQLAQAAPPSGQDQRRQFGDWFMSCPAEAAGCTIGHQLNQSEGNRLVFGLTIRRSEEGRLAASFFTPLGVLLNRGLALRIDDQERVAIGFTICRPGRCQADATLSPEVMARILEASDLTASFHTAGGQAVNVSISRNGLAPAYAALTGG